MANGLAPVEVALTLPKFEFRTHAGFNPALRELGMAAAFDPETADFSEMTTAEALFILHQRSHP
ncbi:MAG: hypothetical protein OEM84_11225 [Acidimicrobiia bacterium]|nr:hypothetical protein [Acidimicrobiia bacterium]MDH5615772.1 hypothetical protein [Acidimicrobiia bacterium]